MNRFSFKNVYHKNYFEGWYTRLINHAGTINLAIIFAMTTNETDPHAFIQIFDGNNHTNRYLRFPLEAFTYDRHVVNIEDNRLSIDRLVLNDELYKLDVTFNLEHSLKGKSAMGFLGWLRLECFQEVITLEDAFTGHINEQAVDGTVYMEKTFGRKFPEQWFWLQSNRFAGDTQVSLAGGRIPTFKKKPFGFFCLLKHDNKTYRFATYNGAKLKMNVIENTITFTIRSLLYRMEIKVAPHKTTMLKGPGDKAEMILDVAETLKANVTLDVYRGKQNIIHDKGEFAGLEWMYH